MNAGWGCWLLRLRCIQPTMITPSTTKNHRHAGDMSRCVKGLLKGLMGVLVLFAVLSASVILLAYFLPALFGLKTMYVTSGSMEPSIRTGDALLVRSLSGGSSVAAGDVITYRNDHNDGMTTHRVKAVKQIQGMTYYQTQGDANSTPDPDLTAAQSVYGKQVMTLPKVGYLLHFATTPWGKLLLVAVPLLILMSKELSSLVRYFRRPRASEDIAPYDSPNPA